MPGVERRTTMLGWQRPLGTGASAPLFRPDEKQINIPVSREWLEALGWSAERPELNLVLDEHGIHITPTHPKSAEEARVFVGAAGSKDNES